MRLGEEEENTKETDKETGEGGGTPRMKMFRLLEGKGVGEWAKKSEREGEIQASSHGMSESWG